MQQRDPTLEDRRLIPVSGAVVRDAWLGFAPAGPDEIAATEARLGRVLPPMVHEFLVVTNG